MKNLEPDAVTFEVKSCPHNPKLFETQLKCVQDACFHGGRYKCSGGGENGFTSLAFAGNVTLKPIAASAGLGCLGLTGGNTHVGDDHVNHLTGCGHIMA